MTFRQENLQPGRHRHLATTLDRTLNRTRYHGLASSQIEQGLAGFPLDGQLGGAYKPKSNQSLAVDFGLGIMG